MKAGSRQVHVWYLFHSGFAIKTPGRLFIFDYFPQTTDYRSSGLDSGEINPLEIKDLDVFVFCSHEHYDHFSPVIFEWRKHIKNIHYVLSHEIKISQEMKDLKNVLRIKPGHSCKFAGLDITALASTDAGSAFLVEDDGLTIFHAGDLNWWHWEGEPESDNIAMALEYKKQIDLLKGRDIDLAFIPLDPRLEEHYLLGLDYFMRTVGCRIAFPMHFGEDYSVFLKFKDDSRADEYRDNVVQISHRGQKFSFQL